MAHKTIAFFEARVNFRSHCIALSKKLGFYNILRSLYFRILRQINKPTSTIAYNNNIKTEHLTAHTRRIYVDMKDAFLNQQNGAD